MILPVGIVNQFRMFFLCFGELTEVSSNIW